MRADNLPRGGRACAHQRLSVPSVRRGIGLRCTVLSPPREEAASLASSHKPSISVTIDEVRRPVAADMDILVENLLGVVGNRHPMLMAAAQQIFGAGGKKLRPMLVFLVARATTKHMNAR
jgi:all-trans-nonaprenyl-diphosphate synthase